MRRAMRGAIGLGVVGMALATASSLAQGPGTPGAARVADGVQYAADGRVVKPSNYREWVFLSSGLGMTYGPTRPAAGGPPLFDNVFVNPQAYRAFLASGRWPEGTMFILELRRSVVNASINNGGNTQADVAAIEAAVKDSTRFADTGGWKYLEFGASEAAAPLPATASCYACHSRFTAVENTFVQFYPTLFPVAREKGTVKPTYDPNRKVE